MNGPTLLVGSDPTLLIGSDTTLLVGDGRAVLVGCCGVGGLPRVSGRAPSLIGCGPVGCVVGAEELGESAGVWVKTHFYRKGPFLCATVYSVAAGEPKVFELEVDTRPIARAVVRAHAALHAKDVAQASLRSKSGATVGWGLGSLWKGVKKTASAIGRNKLVKGVANVVKSVAKNPIAQALNPALAITAHTTSRAMGSKGVLKGALGKAVDRGTGAALAATGGGAVAAAPLVSRVSTTALGAYSAANQALAGVEAGRRLVQTAQQAQSVIRQGSSLARSVQAAARTTNAAVKTAGALMPAKTKQAIAARTAAATKIALSAKGRAAVAATLARAPAAARAKVATAIASKLKGLATLKGRVELAKSLPPTAQAAVLRTTALQLRAAPLVMKAQTTARTLASPTVQKRLLAIKANGAAAQAALEKVAHGAQTGGLDAKKNAVIVNLVARNRARIQALSQANAGGLPGLLITKDGKIRRGRWRIQAVADQGAVLYTGPNKASERGTYQTVSGTSLFGEPVEVESGEGVRLSSVAVNGDLPLDGVRLTGKGPASFDIGPYEVSGRSLIGCGDSPCAPCAAKA